MSYRRTGTIVLLAFSVALFVICALLVTRRAGQESAEVAPEITSGTAALKMPAAQGVSKAPENPSAVSTKPLTARPLAQWIQTTVKKRDSSAPVAAGSLFQDGVGLLETGNYREARISFQKLINQHPGSRFASYAFLGIAESYRMEGGREQLWQAAMQFRDFLVFFPNSELATYARERFNELEPIMKAENERRRREAKASSGFPRPSR